jgi:predicted RecA/RadA family phage recombinase
MKNLYLRDADVLDMIAPAGGVTSGIPVLIGGIWGIPLVDAAEGEEFSLRVRGVFIVAKKTGEAWTQGQRLYWDDANSYLTTAAGSGTVFVGKAHVAAASDDTTGQVWPNHTGQNAGQALEATLTAPSGGVVAGTPLLIGNLLVLPLETVGETLPFRAQVGGIATMPILGTDTPGEGADLYWDDGNTRLTTTASTHKLHASALEAKESGPTTILVLLGAYSGTLTN